MPHEGIVRRSYATDDAFSRQFINPVQGQQDVEITVSVLVIVVIVGDGEVLLFGLRRNHAKGGISLRVVHVEGPVRLQVQASGGNQADPAARQGFADRSPGYIRIHGNARRFAPENSE